MVRRAGASSIRSPFRRADQPADRRAPAGERDPDRRHHAGAGRGQAPARDLQVRARHHAASRSSTACSARSATALQPDLGTGGLRTCRIKTPEELVILASIVEKETGLPTSAAASRRSSSTGSSCNMRLQSDPTVIYGIFGGAGTLGRWHPAATRSRQPTPYNTYVINGAAPGADRQSRPRRRMEAVANPVAHERSLLRRRRHRRPRLRRDLRRAPAQRRPLAGFRSDRNASEPDQIDPGDAEAGDQRGDLLDPSAPTAFGATAATGALVRDASLVGRQLDVSEGTALDPLRNTTFSLDSPETVPDIDPLPGEEGATSAQAAATARLTAPDSCRRAATPCCAAMSESE